MDDARTRPIALVLRAPLRAVVEALRAGDFALRSRIPMVEPPGEFVARQIEEYLEDYGETLQSLPEAAWFTAVAQWTGTGWDLLVDLWTAESGRSDLVLAARVTPHGRDYRIQIMGVHVP